MVSVQQQLILFHERKEGMQLLMDRSLAVLTRLRTEGIQVPWAELFLLIVDLERTFLNIWRFALLIPLLCGPHPILQPFMEGG